MLVLEQEVLADREATENGRGELAHFYAVSTYVLQHPESMRYQRRGTGRGTEGHRRAPDGPDDTGRWRTGVTSGRRGPTRVLRRPGEETVRWTVEAWPMTVADVLSEGGVSGNLETCRRLGGLGVAGARPGGV